LSTAIMPCELLSLAIVSSLECDDKLTAPHPRLSRAWRLR
jgi:hypothetical protein